MSMRSTPFKFAVAAAFWALLGVAWATIYQPTSADVFATTADITVTGSEQSHKGEGGIISAYKNAPGGTQLQTCGFYCNATSGDFQKSSSDTGKPVLAAPPWPGNMTRIYIQALLDSGTSAGLTYCWTN